VFSEAPKLDAPIVVLPVISTFWLSVLTNDAVKALDAVKAWVAYEAVPKSEPENVVPFTCP